MRKLFNYLAPLFASTVLVASLRADECTPPSSGPDAVVMDVVDNKYWATIGDISAFSFGSDILNKGDVPLPWNSQLGITQNVYRLKNNRFEQIGMSWVKLVGSAATQWTYCGCLPPGSASVLGVGCSDIYDASINGAQAVLGPRSSINAYQGTPPKLGGTAANAVERRLQVRVSDLDPALNPGAQYFVELQLVSPSDSNAGNSMNNSSYEPRIVLTSQGAFFLGGGGITESKVPCINAWNEMDSSVSISMVDLPNEGRFSVAARVGDNGDGTWHYEYAISNQNSHRSAQSFAVPIHSGIAVSNIGFHDVDYHSGEAYDGTDWPGVHANGTVTWSTNSFDINPNANALRWGTLYNFRFDADAPPSSRNAVLGLFRLGTPSTVPVTVPAPVIVVPVLSFWSFALMAAVLVIAACIVLRRRRFLE